MKRLTNFPYPYDRASKVQVISYRDRMYEEPITEEADKTQTSKDSILQFAGLQIPNRILKEQLVLNNTQRDSLFSVLNANMCGRRGSAICYNPRHAFVFLDSSLKPYAFIEICLDCISYETSADIEFDFCYEKAEELKKLLQSFGIQYYGERGF